MKLEDLLRRKRPAILDRWRKLITETYPEEMARFLASEDDQFANPVGHFIRHGTEVLLEEIHGDLDRDVIRDCMDPVVRIRAVQDFTPSEAVGFVFLLKKAVLVTSVTVHSVTLSRSWMTTMCLWTTVSWLSRLRPVTTSWALIAMYLATL